MKNLSVLTKKCRHPMNKLIPHLVSGFGNINFGKQFRQGNRVYSVSNIAMALCSQPLGNVGGYSYLYLTYEHMDK